MMLPHYEHGIIRRAMIVILCDTLDMAIGKKTLVVSQLEDLVNLNGFILWNYQGSWGLVSTPHLIEWLRNIELFKRQKKQYPRLVLKVPTIDFRSTIPVSDRVARVLRSQKLQKINQSGTSPKAPAGS